MTRYKDMTNERYGKLVAKEYVGKDKFNNALWRCECDCGGTTIATRKALVSGDKQSCGCLHEQRLEGQRFGRLAAIKKIGVNAHRNNLWLCKCDCGNEIETTASNLIGGHTQSCGCLMRETSKKTMTTHGKTNTRLYTVWSGMRARCNNSNHEGYKNYGGRGISICEEWNDFETFEKWAYENGYDEDAKRGDCTIDRIDNNGNYEPSNCRWVDSKTQIKNRRPIKKGYKRGSYKKRS